MDLRWAVTPGLRIAGTTAAFHPWAAHLAPPTRGAQPMDEPHRQFRVEIGIRKAEDADHPRGPGAFTAPGIVRVYLEEAPLRRGSTEA